MSDGPGLEDQRSTFRRSAFFALLWSMAQGWAGRTVASVIFFLLAQLLRPVDFGIASSAFLAISFLSLIAEFGFGDAIIQRAAVKPQDLNLPFYASLGGSILLALMGMLLAPALSTAMGVPGLTPYLIGALAILPLMALANFQEALYRRELRYRSLALRTLAAVICGGFVGVGLALARFGPWAIIAQFATQTLVSIMWLWRGSHWRPGLRVDRGSFRELARFGSNLLGMRVVDFVTLRSVDLIILKIYGPAAVGLFGVSSRLYQLLMQLFQSSLSNVGLSVLSRIAHDKARLRGVFIRSTSISAMVGTPVFFGLAALAPEVTAIMFGPKWAGAELIMRPLLLIGGIHCVQFTMGAYLTAAGRPRVLLQLMLLKAAFVLPPLLLLHFDTVQAMATAYALSLAAEFPFILMATLKAVGGRVKDLAIPVGVPLAASLMAFLCADAVRGYVPIKDGFVARSIILSVCFTTVYFAMLAISPRTIVLNMSFVRRISA